MDGQAYKPDERSGLATIDPTSPIPLYSQIKESILAYIRANRLTENDPLPSEREFSALFGVNRLTVRKAIDHLERQGVIFRQAGKGTYISMPKLEQRLLVVTSFSEAIRQAGHTPGARLLEKHVEPAGSLVAEALAIGVGTPVVRLVRLRSVDDVPFSVSTSYLEAERVPDILDLVEKHSFYGLLEDAYHLKLAKTRAELEAVTAEEPLVTILRIKRGAALFLMSGVVSDPKSRPIEFFEAYYRGDRLKFLAESGAKG